MGDPKKIRKKYRGPSHPWQKTRIEEEKALTKEYALQIKKEIWKANSLLDDFKNQVKKLNAMISVQAEKEKNDFKTKMISLGLMKAEDELDHILSLGIKDILERRLQTMLFRKNLARTMKQARQFIIHRHVAVNGTKVTVPSYLVKINEENSITFSLGSTLSDPNHPERFEELPKDKETKKKDKEEKKKQEEEALAFEDVPKDEEAIVKDIKPKKVGEKTDAPKVEEKTDVSKIEEKVAEPKVEEKTDTETQTKPKGEAQ